MARLNVFALECCTGSVVISTTGFGIRPRLAIDRAWQGRGLGRALLADAVKRSLRASAEVSARLVIVHAISPAAEGFYLHHGFTRLPVETRAFALDLVKFQKLAKQK